MVALGVSQIFDTTQEQEILAVLFLQLSHNGHARCSELSGVNITFHVVFGNQATCGR